MRYYFDIKLSCIQTEKKSTPYNVCDGETEEGSLEIYIKIFKYSYKQLLYFHNVLYLLSLVNYTYVNYIWLVWSWQYLY